MGLFNFFKKGSNSSESSPKQFTAANTPVGEITHLLDMNVPLQLFKTHKITSTLEEKELHFTNRYTTAYARLFRKSEGPTLILQLDFCLEIGFGKTIMESCVGMGDNAAEAIDNAWQNFALNSLHVMLAAFFEQDCKDQVETEDWTINNHTYKVYLGAITTKGQKPASFSVQWFSDLETIIKQQPLTSGLHWIRFYRAADATQIFSTEILLDNESWQELETPVQHIVYPTSETFFSYRIFLILKPAFDLARAASIIAGNTNTAPETVHALLIQEGMSADEAARAYAFIPLAFGRVFLQNNTQANFSATAILITDKETEINLSDEPIYTQAYAMAEDALLRNMPNKEQFVKLISQSAELNAYNNALNEGAKAESLNNATFGKPMITL